MSPVAEKFNVKDKDKGNVPVAEKFIFVIKKDEDKGNVPVAEHIR